MEILKLFEERKIERGNRLSFPEVAIPVPRFDPRSHEYLGKDADIFYLGYRLVRSARRIGFTEDNLKENLAKILGFKLFLFTNTYGLSINLDSKHVEHSDMNGLVSPLGVLAEKSLFVGIGVPIDRSFQVAGQSNVLSEFLLQNPGAIEEVLIGTSHQLSRKRLAKHMTESTVNLRIREFYLPPSRR